MIAVSSGCRCSPSNARRRGGDAQARALEQRRVGEHGIGGGVGGEVPGIHHDHAIGVLGDELQIVRDHDDRRAPVAEVVEHRHHLVGAGAILSVGRLVEHEQAGSADERRPHRQSSLLPAREQERVDVGAIGEAEPREHLVDAASHLRLGHPQPTEAVGELVEDGRRDELVLGVLEHEPDVARQPSRGQASHVAPVDAYGAARRPPDAGDRLDQGRLAGAVGADDGDEPAFPHVEVDGVHDGGAPPRHPQTAHRTIGSPPARAGFGRGTDATPGGAASSSAARSSPGVSGNRGSA